MIVKVKDLLTGNEAWTSYPFDIIWWVIGNGACDCNRADMAFNQLVDCNGDKNRFIAVDIADHPEISIKEAMLKYNKDRNPILYTKEDVLVLINNN